MIANSLNDPRTEWRARDSALDRIERDLTSWQNITNGDLVVVAALEDLRKRRGDFQKTLQPLDAAIEAHDSAELEVKRLVALEEFGTDDRKVALKMRDDICVAQARLRHFAKAVQSAAASCSSARERLASVHSSPLFAEVEAARDIAMRLIQGEGITTSLREVLRASGTRATAKIVAAWAAAEEVAKVDFLRETEALRKQEKARERDFRRIYPSIPTEAQLDQAFAERRRAYEMQVAKVREQLSALGGELKSLEGSAA